MSTNDFLPQEKPRNPVTREAHKHQAFWQIYFPMILFGAFVLVAIVAAFFLESEGASKWADISLIYMVSLAIVIFLITFILTVGMIYFTAKLTRATPYFFFVVQRYFYIMELRVKQASDKAAEPFLRINSFIAGARALRKK